MKTLLTTTALVAGLATCSALSAAPGDSPFAFESASASDVQASNLIGMRVYIAEPAADGSDWTMTETAGVQTDWDDVGEINDLIITRDGAVVSVLVDIGGFLGLGERQVAMDMDDIRFVADTETEAADDFFLVIPAAMAEMEKAPIYASMTPRATDSTPFHKTAAEARDVRPYDTNALTAEEVAVLTTEDLTGARVYDAKDEWIGEVGQLTLTDAGKIDAAIIDVGGFLGMGEKPVRLSIDELTINRMTEDDGFRVSVPMSEAQLEALPTWQNS